jgi:hypothetical protein
MGASEGPASGSPAEAGAPPPPGRAPAPAPPRYGRYFVLLVGLILVLITINTITTRPNGSTGVAPGTRAPPFAAPLAIGNLPGEADVATRPHQGAAGKVPACQERGPEILNVCELYEQAPVVLALFVDSGSCPEVLSDLQALKSAYPRVRFAAVAIKGGTAGVRKLIRSKHLTFPVGLDRDGVLAALYRVASCPQISFIARGGVVHSRALLGRPSQATLRSRVAALAASTGPSATGAK